MPIKKAVVTGCSSGIGKAIADSLLAEGWDVVGVCRSAIEPHHPSLRIVRADVSDPTQHAEICECIQSDQKPIHAFIHAAGFMKTAALGSLNIDDGLAMWRVHVQAAEGLANGLLPHIADGGRIGLIGSRIANGAPTRSQYAAVKAAMIGMTRSWAAELAHRGITANVVAPGATDTPFLRDPGRANTMPKMPPIGRFVDVADVVGLVGYLVGPCGGAMTGQQLVVCGGASL